MPVDYLSWKDNAGICRKQSTKAVFSVSSVRNDKRVSGMSKDRMMVTKDRTRGY